MPSPVDEKLIVDIRRRLAQAVRRGCPGWLASHAEDIVQVALMKVLESANKKGECNPDFSSFYLEKAAYFVMVDEIRRHNRRMEDQPGEGHLTAARSPEATGPEAIAAAREIAAGLGECLRVLKAPRRPTVTLHLQGHSVPEIAALLRQSIKTTENLLFRGLANLRRCLATKGLAR